MHSSCGAGLLTPALRIPWNVRFVANMPPDSVLLLIVPVCLSLWSRSVHGQDCSMHAHGQFQANYHVQDTHSHRVRRSADSALEGEAKALFLSSQNALQHTGNVALPRLNFSLVLLIRPEGGQAEPAIIAELSDTCNAVVNQPSWQLGIRTPSGDGARGARYFFTLRTEMAKAETTVWSQPYVPAQWTHVGLTYDGKWMKLYVNGARVAQSSVQRGPMFSQLKQRCKKLLLGGAVLEQTPGFRGFLKGLYLSHDGFDHQQMAEHYRTVFVTKSSANLSHFQLSENFENLGDWTSFGMVRPAIVSAPDLVSQTVVEIDVPPCGKTACDNPAVVKRYAESVDMRSLKILRYRVVNIAEDDGSNPSVPAYKVRQQHNHLNQAFEPYNISWRMEQHILKSSYLRHKLLMFFCESSMVGNSRCEPECRLAMTRNDGGDCDAPGTLELCQATLLHNGECDPVCNRVEFGWDSGDCCNTSLSNVRETCIDPTSPHRAYIGIEEFKQAVNFTNDVALTVMFARWNNEDLIALSTFPWEKEIYTALGGIVLQHHRVGSLGYQNNLVHEIGHVLGLWHVHHGVTEVEGCSHPCREIEPSMLTGDLVADTNPTPRNSECKEPTLELLSFRGQHDVCDNDLPYTNTPFRNYMSYAGDACTNHFTPQQTARMHCYIDLKYRAWLERKTVPVVPFAPVLVPASSSDVLLISWLPPLTASLCSVSQNAAFAHCTDDGVVVQFAATASVGGQHKSAGYWSPLQAIGRPDAEVCKASPLTWLAGTTSCEDARVCTLKLGLSVPVVPRRLDLWVSWNAVRGILDVQLVFTDGTSRLLSNMTVYCDMPFTTMLDETRELSEVLIRTTHHIVGVDALRIHSVAHHSACAPCKQIQYTVFREPPFEGASPTRTTTELKFEDSEIQSDKSYQYWITTNEGQIASPILYYNATTPVCGNGIVETQAGEQCDDANLNKNDGCSESCVVEPSFRCTDQPSVCYIYEGDGICEDFELKQGLEDCGYFTPPGFKDQFAMESEASSEQTCPSSPVRGPPTVRHCSLQQSDAVHAWRPCDLFFSTHAWLKVTFDEAVLASSVLVYLAFVGTTNDSPNGAITVTLLSESAIPYIVDSSSRQMVSCDKNPVEYPIAYDFSKPLFYTKTVQLNLQSHLISITAVALRHRRAVNPLMLALCMRQRMLYDPVTELCSPSSCGVSVCAPKHVDHADLDCNITDGSVGHISSAARRCAVRCHAGYEAPVHEIMCVNGQWKPAVTCEPKLCPWPHLPHAVFQCPDGTGVGKTCSFQCGAPAIKQGSDSNVQCMPDCIWSVPEAYCSLSCPPPEPMPHSRATKESCRVLYQVISNNSLQFPLGAECRYVCEPGYQVERRRSRRKRSFEMTCTESGTWRGPRCVPIRCPVPLFAHYTQYNCTRGFSTGSECTVVCPDAITTTARCRTDRTWEMVKPCRPPAQPCTRPAVPRDLKVVCPNTTVIGVSCKVGCLAYGYEAVQRQALITEGSVKLQVLEPVSHIVCTKHRIWEPDPLALQCIKKCSTKFINDGWCDFQNNRGYCRWDGGDCCASTTKGGLVRHMFPSLCSSPLCTCLDPFALENHNRLEKRKALFKANVVDVDDDNGTIAHELPANAITYTDDVLVADVTETSGDDQEASREQEFGLHEDGNLEELSMWYKTEHTKPWYLQSLRSAMYRALQQQYKRLQGKV